MAYASYVSAQLARFDTLRPAGGGDAADLPGVLFCQIAADTRAAATPMASQQAYTFLILGLHSDSDSASQLIAERYTRAPWLREAHEVWAGVLQPFRNKGEANYLNPEHPGPLFESLAPAPDRSAPLVILTSVGWDTGDAFDSNRVADFSVGVTGVRTSMTSVQGLHSQQSFMFSGGLKHDPTTVTFWKDDAAVLTFAYGAGVHRAQMERYRAENLADRTSFTRYVVLQSEGTWYGSNPLAG